MGPFIGLFKDMIYFSEMAYIVGHKLVSKLKSANKHADMADRKKIVNYGTRGPFQMQ
jgi:hypothetical protein